MKKLLKENEIITLKELKKIIKQFRLHSIIHNGQLYMPHEIEGFELSGNDRFKVIFNYAHEVQFHLISDRERCEIVTHLCGMYSDSEGYHAVYNG